MQGRSARESPRPTRTVALTAAAATLALGLLVTATVGVSLRAAAHRDAEAQFQDSAAQTGAAVQRVVDGYFNRLRDVGSFVANVPAASSEQFKGFLAQANTFQQLPSLAGVLYLSRVDDAGLDAFVAQQQVTNPGLVLTQLSPEPHVPGTPRFILTYYAPKDEASDLKLPLGADITPIKSLTDLMDSSGAQSKGITGSLQKDPLLQQIASVTEFKLIKDLIALDFFIGVPVYPQVNPADPGVAPNVPIGWVGAPVNHFQDVVTEASTGQPDHLGLSLTVDLTSVGLGQRDDLSRVASQEGNAGPPDQAAFTTTIPFESYGVQFSVTIWSTAGADSVPSTVYIFLAGGIFASMLAAGVAYLRFRAHDRERAFAHELEDRAQFQRDIVDSVNSPMVVLDNTGRIVAANPAWATLRGQLPPAADRDERSEGADIGRLYVEVLSPSVRVGEQSLAAEINDVLVGAVDTLEVDLPIEQGSRRRWFAVRATTLQGSRGGAVVLHSDITERKHSLDELEFKANRDNLTGLLNRLALESEIDSALLRARADESQVAALFIDLDGFKAINDTYGHAAGDDFLRTVAQRISSAVRSNDRVARLGGDEFVVLIAPLREPGMAEATAERILRHLAEPIQIGDRSLRSAASIGVAVVDAPLGGTSEDLLDRADQAMYLAKQGGGSDFKLSH